MEPTPAQAAAAEAAASALTSDAPLPATLGLLLWEGNPGQLRLMEDCCRLLDSEVSSRRGLRGATLRAGYSAVRQLKPGIIGYVVGKLAPDVLAALQPQWEKVRAGAGRADAPAALRSLLVAEDEAVTEALVGVTDALIKKARVPIQIAYSALRSEAGTHVRASVPAFAELLARHVAERLATSA